MKGTMKCTEAFSDVKQAIEIYVFVKALNLLVLRPYM